MDIYFRHYAGAITEYDYLFFDCMAVVPLVEENQALEKGWLPDDYLIKQDSLGNTLKSHWYQARQTRIDLRKFKDTRSTRKARKKCKDITTKCLNAKEVDLSILNDIFNKYFEYRNFKKWDLEPLIFAEPHRKYFLLYYQNNKPIAFTFMRDVGSNSVFSTQFAWDYESPKLYLGKYANLAEIDYCMEHDKDYMYLGFGYEKSCIYKADYAGFEFWTGEEWSDNIERYKFLCERDSQLKSLNQLDKCKEHDDKKFFK
jgi:hypothetical protein